MPGLVRRVGVCVSVWGGYGGSVGSGVELKFWRGKNGPLPHVAPNSLTFVSHEGFLGCCWEEVKAEVKNGESDE